VLTRRAVMGLLAGAFLAGAARRGSRLEADEPKPREKKKSGTVAGVLTAKGSNWIEVRADGEEKGRRYVPHWVGGAPKDGGGPDRKMVRKIKELEVGTRVRLEWEFEERPRVVKVEVLKAPGDASPKRAQGP
jgi:hypothetical protein